MNRLVLSLLIGFIITAFTALLLGKIKRFSDPAITRTKYDGEIVLKVDSIAGSPRQLLMQTKDVLSRRLKYFGQKFTVEEMDTNKLRVSVTGYFDSASLRKMLVSRGEISIWELYTGEDLAEWKSTLQKALDVTVPDIVPVARDTTASPEVQRMVDSIGEARREKFSDQVEFPDPSDHPSEALCVHSIWDTAGITAIIRSSAVEARLPNDAKAYYSGLSEGCGLALYIVKTGKNKMPPLDRDDIEEIYYDEFRIVPAVVIRLTAVGRRKMEKLAQNNQDYVQVLVMRDNEVLTGVRVEKKSWNGKLSLHLNLQPHEFFNQARLLNAQPLNAAVTVESSTLREQHPEEKPLNPWLLVFCFVFFSALAFIIFKVLKNSPHQKKTA